MEGRRHFEAQMVETPEAAMARREDAMVRATFANPEAERTLYKTNPVGWLKGAIGLDTERGQSEVSDRELMVRLVKYGRYEWDPFIAKSVAAYLRRQGFSWSY